MPTRTVADLRAFKGKRQILALAIETADEAAAAHLAEIDMVMLLADDRLPSIRSAAKDIFIQAAHPQGTLCSEDEAIRIAFQTLEAGASAIYFAGSLRILEAMAREGIPVTSHVGYIPRWHTWTNTRSIGKTVAEAVAIKQRLTDLENAGAWAVEMELVPVELAALLTAETTLVTEGMGCGSVCDAQYLFACDVLGSNTGRVPRHAKVYANLATELERLQSMRVRAMAEWVGDVRAGTFPQREHEIHLDEARLNEIRSALSK